MKTLQKRKVYIVWTILIKMAVTADPLYAIAAAIAIAGGLIGTGLAQQGIGAAGMGVIAERPEKFGQVLFFFVIPETLWIIGFVLGLILLLQIL
jgi:V/A-type H+-transporting ATPase subunit K